MRTKLLIVFFTSLTTWMLAQNDTENGRRDGLLFEVSMGATIIMVEDSENIQTFDDVQEGISFPELKLGYFVNEKLAVTASIPGKIYKSSGNDRHFGSLIPSLQYWVSNKWWIHGGIGLSLDSPALYDINDDNDDWNVGCGVMASTGIEVFQRTNYVINLQSKIHLGRTFLDDDVYRDIASMSVGVGIQF